MAADWVSAVIPARNEEANIARAVRSVAAQPEVAEIIVVDDHSEDGTSSILEALEEETPRLRVIRLDQPPPGWFGKAYAAAVGAGAASGTWLLFTDADTEHQPGSLGQVLDHARSERAQLVSLSPGQETPTWWEKAIIPYVFVELARRYRFQRINDPKCADAAANGQYLLIRRTAYEAVGGHEAVRGEMLEDVRLARLVKGSGRRILFLPGSGWVKTRMYRRFGEMRDGWRKNLYLLEGSSLLGTSAAFARAWFLDLLPPLAFVVGLALALAGGGLEPAVLCLAGLAAMAVRRVAYGRAIARLGFAPGIANYGILGAGIFSALLVDSMAAHRWLGSVRWKGREYPTGRTAKGSASRQDPGATGPGGSEGGGTRA